MSALSDLSDVVNLATGGGVAGAAGAQNIFFYKDARVAAAAAAATVAGRLTSLWAYNGAPMGAGVAPGATARNPDNTTAGSLGQTSPGGSRQQWLLGITGAPLAAGTLFMYDRLADISGLSGTTITAQTLTGLSVSRYTGTAAAGNSIFLEINTQIGATGTTVTASYTNQAGTSGRTTVATAFGSTSYREAQRMIQLPLQSGDIGVQSVQSVTVLATTGTAGDFGVSIMRQLAAVPLSMIGSGSVRDFIAGLPGPVEILAGACLSFGWLANTTTAPQIVGSVHLVEK